MSVIEPYIKSLSKTENSLERVARRIVVENTDFIMFLIKDKQLSLGMKSSGVEAGRYNKRTEEFAKDPFNRPRKEKAVGQPYNFEWQGGFFDTMFIKTGTSSFEIISRDSVQQILEAKYGKLTQLTKKNMDIINDEVILPNLRKYILENMFKI